MKSIQTLLTNLYTALNAIDDNLYIYHYERAEDFTLPYGVWGEDGEADSFHGDNKKKEQVIAGYLDFYTQTEFDPLVDEIQITLDDLENCSWNLDSVLYEDETKLIHYSWRWELI